MLSLHHCRPLEPGGHGSAPLPRCVTGLSDTPQPQCLSFLTYKMEMIIKSTLEGHWEN